MNEEHSQPEHRDIISSPKIERICTPDGREISFSTERGGIITSLKLGGKELLYFDVGTFNDLAKNVKGGIPILFPNAGPIEHPDFPNLKQHGFARNADAWKIDSISDRGFVESLHSDETTRELFPYDFLLKMRGEFDDDGSFTLIQEVKNESADRAMPVSMGLHPYFRVPADRKGEIKFNFPGGEIAEQGIEKWNNGKAVSLDNPSTEEKLVPLNIVIPELGTVVITASPEYQRIWIWSAGPDSSFICVEPVMRDKGGLVENPELIQPGQTIAPKIKIELKD